MAHVIDGAASIYMQKGSGMLKHSQEKHADLSPLNQYLVECAALEELAETAAHQIVDSLELDYCRVILVDDQGRYSCNASYPRPVTLLGMGKRFIPALAESVYARLMHGGNRRGLLLAQEHLSREERINLGIRDDEVSWVIPLRIESRGLGALIIGQRAAPGNLSIDGDYYYLFDLISDQVARAIQRTRAFEKNDELVINKIVTLIRDLEKRDTHSASHSRRMAMLSEQIASQYQFSVRETRELCWAALLHDIGKLRIDDFILKKAGPLTDDEWRIMKTHSRIGAKIVADLAGLEDLAPLILSHHERVDGAGYPQGLTGEEIPLGGKILAVIDSYTVMTEGRPYRVKCSHEEALAELAKNRGTAFDPDVIDKFIAIFKS